MNILAHPSIQMKSAVGGIMMNSAEAVNLHARHG